ncbi:MAG: ATP-dependent helicase [Planctomycetes bacterium]|nr:ATP-dependent helicase [Planctomycetota bacterium]
MIAAFADPQVGRMPRANEQAGAVIADFVLRAPQQGLHVGPGLAGAEGIENDIADVVPLLQPYDGIDAGDFLKEGVSYSLGQTSCHHHFLDLSLALLCDGSADDRDRFFLGRLDESAGIEDDERLVLSSAHQAKGLEWKVVFVIRMCDGEFPSSMALRETNGEEEERRIRYVATARAKEELYITYPLMNFSLRGNNQLLLQPSRFLQELPMSLYENAELNEVTQDEDNIEPYCQGGH